MDSLTQREHWDAVHASERAEVTRPRLLAGGHWRATLKNLVGQRLLATTQSYDDHQIWNVLYPRFMPRPGATVVEIGSAPGEHLVRLRERFGLVPYGIEYSASGVEVNRALFAARGLDPAHVIPMDFFSEECRARYREHFDVVVSRGFIEHFKDPAGVVDRHLELLKPGGLLIVTIPNLRGLNHGLTRLFHPELLPMHNLQIMARDPFLGLFDPDRVEALDCAYVGTFSFYLFSVTPGSRLAPVLWAAMKAQVLLNATFRACFGDRGAENRFTSPQLFFAGRKKAGR
jgi:SAM-dependent methyltransferase